MSVLCFYLSALKRGASLLMLLFCLHYHCICSTFHKVCVDLKQIQVSVAQIWLDFFCVSVCPCLRVCDFYLKANGYICTNLSLRRKTCPGNLCENCLLHCFVLQMMLYCTLQTSTKVWENDGVWWWLSFLLILLFFPDTSGVVFDTRSKMVMSQGGTTERMKEKVESGRRCAWRKQRACRAFSHHHTWNVEL